MNWFLVGGGALIVFWLAGRRVAKRDAATPEPVFGSGDGAGAAGAGGPAYYGGGGGGDGGFSLATPTLAPIGSDIQASEPKIESLQGSFIKSIGFKPYDKTVSQFEDEDEDRSAFARSASIPGSGPQTMVESIGKMSAPSQVSRSAQVAAATSSSTALGQSTLSMSALPATVNNSSAVSAAVQAQPPRSFSSVSASISEKNMMPTIYAKPAVAIAKPAVTVVTPMPVRESFVAAIRPVSVALSPTSRLASLVRR